MFFFAANTVSAIMYLFMPLQMQHTILTWLWQFFSLENELEICNTTVHSRRHINSILLPFQILTTAFQTSITYIKIKFVTTKWNV